MSGVNSERTSSNGEFRDGVMHRAMYQNRTAPEKTILTAGPFVHLRKINDNKGVAVPKLRDFAFAFAVAAVLAAGPAQAAVILDQNALYTPRIPAPGETYASLVTVAGNRSVAPPATSFVDRRFVQSMTAGIAGTLSSVGMQINRPFIPDGTTGDFQFSLIDGDFGTGARNILASISIPFFAVNALIDINGLLTIDISELGYAVSSGQKFSIMGQVNTAAPNFTISALLGQVLRDPNNLNGPPIAFYSTNYAGGAMYSFNGPSPQMVMASPYDIGFRTFVDTGISAVPETTTWAMMIAGFGLVGGMMRASRQRSGRAAAV